MIDVTKNYIGGQWRAPRHGSPKEIVNPATGDVSGQIMLSSKSELDEAVAAAKRAFGFFAQTTREERMAMLDALIAAYEARFAEMADCITREMGAPRGFSQRAQTPMGLVHLKLARDILETYPFHEDRGHTRILQEPIGVVGMITPWNWPINQITAKVGPALATGCTMVLKPSELAPYSAELFADMVDAAGLPAGIFNMVMGTGPDVGSALARHPDVDMVSITGSVRAGAAVQAVAAPTIKRVTQELGGKSANILLDDLNEDGFAAAVRRGVKSVMTNSGQSCTAQARMLVPADRMDEAAEIAAGAAEALLVGIPESDETIVGPLAHAGQYEKVVRLILQAQSDGARLMCGGAEPPDHVPAGGFYVSPTVFADVTPDMTIAREEIFGPVITLMGYDGEEDAIEIANDSDYGLSGAVQSANVRRAQRVAGQLRTGMVLLNGAKDDFTAPFGGYKQSGNGREWGDYAFRDYLETKTVPGWVG